MITATVYSAEELKQQGLQVNRCVCSKDPELLVTTEFISRAYVSCLCGRQGGYRSSPKEAVCTWNEDSLNERNAPAFVRIVAQARAWNAA